MTEPKPLAKSADPKRPPASPRADRLKAALKANLSRRKLQRRERDGAGDARGED